MSVAAAHGWLVAVPVDPSAEEAREWVRRELAKPEYADDRGLLQRVIEWVSELIADLLGRGPGGLPGWVLPVALAVAAGLVALLLLVKVRREARAGGAGRREAVLDETHLRADAYRARARAAHEAGDMEAATMDWFRAIAAGAAERAIIDDNPGRTAHEVSVALTGIFPEEARALARAADQFDAIRYGDVGVDATVARFVGDLDGRLAAARPFIQRARVSP
ncbi:DUF4129 domain-containing protein [Intrasporangium sp.]|uniref:DUF4129 domain-containing protein n=1 Tax=Intrasporangium sp. TaxID=1925024 RepID=UPI003365862F